MHVLLWPLALHFGLYQIKPGQEQRRPPLIGAFWARCLADAPLTLGHLYPAALFKDMLATRRVGIRRDGDRHRPTRARGW